MKHLKVKHLGENKQICACGKQTTIGNADVEIGGVCHRVNNPCYHTDSPQVEESWEKEFWNMCEEVYCGSLSDLHIKKHPKKIYDFIKETIRKDRQKQREEILEFDWVKTSPPDWNEDNIKGYKEAESDLKNYLTKK